MRNRIIWITFFSIAMALLECTVVVYLRELYYPEGFSFPLKWMPPNILTIEIYREAATIVMLLSIGIIMAISFFERLAWFLYCFAVWDIFYYVWLKLILHWPASLLTWDILFLIPVVWISPVLAPVICSVTFLLFALLVFYYKKRGIEVKVNWLAKLLMIAGAIIILYTFLWDYTALIITGGYIEHLDGLLRNELFIADITQFIPHSYNWLIFIAGEIAWIVSIVLIYISSGRFILHKK